MYRKGFGVKFITVISKEPDHIIGFIFVDNTDLEEGNLRSTLDSFDKVAERMQLAIN